MNGPCILSVGHDKHNMACARVEGGGLRLDHTMVSMACSYRNGTGQGSRQSPQCFRSTPSMSRGGMFVRKPAAQC